MARSGQAAMRVQSVTPDVGSTTHPLPLVAASPAALAASRAFPGPAPASLGVAPICRQAPRKSAAAPTARLFAFRTAHLDSRRGNVLCHRARRGHEPARVRDPLLDPPPLVTAVARAVVDSASVACALAARDAVRNAAFAASVTEVGGDLRWIRLAEPI